MYLYVFMWPFLFMTISVTAAARHMDNKRTDVVLESLCQNSWAFYSLGMVHHPWNNMT